MDLETIRKQHVKTHHVCIEACKPFDAVRGIENELHRELRHVDGMDAWSTDIFIGPRAFYLALTEDDDAYTVALASPVSATDRDRMHLIAGPYATDHQVDAYVATCGW